MVVLKSALELGGFVRWYMPEVLALGRPKQYCTKFKASPATYRDLSQKQIKKKKLGVGAHLYNCL